MENSSILIKIIVVGNSGVGKTSILNQYCTGNYDSNVHPTLGCDFSTKILIKNGKTLKIQFWDIAGFISF